MKVKPQKAKVSDLPTPRFLRSAAALAAELNQAGLVRMERQRECLEPLTHRFEEATCVVLMLEAGHQIVSVAHDDHVASQRTPFRPLQVGTAGGQLKRKIAAWDDDFLATLIAACSPDSPEPIGRKIPSGGSL
jgi:hypothetical protein